MNFDTAALRAADKRHFLHPWQEFESLQEHGALVIARGEGSHVYDSDGNRYLDGLGGMWCVNVGYGRRELAQAMAAQAETLPYYSTFTDTTNSPAVQLSRRLAELAPGDLNHVMYSCSGSAANDSAVRLVHYYQSRRGKREKQHILSRKSAYHGSTFLASSLTGRYPDAPEHYRWLTDFIHHLSEPNPYRRPDSMSLEEFTDHLLQEFDNKVAELGANRVGAFIAEPIMGSGGVVVPPPGYLRRIRERCAEHDILFIADEVVTAFGRLGHFFASVEEFGIQPDMIVCAKGITSGYIPLGATLFSDEIFEVISKPGDDPCFEHGFTYSGHPVACAVALENIAIMERENICEHVQIEGEYFEQQMRSLAELPYVGEVRGRRFMIGIEYVADKETRTLLPEELDVSHLIADACQQRGLLVRPMGHLDVLSPPLIMQRSEIDQMVSILRESILVVGAEIDRKT